MTSLERRLRQRKRHQSDRYKQVDPRLADLYAEMLTANGGPLLRFERDGGGLCFRLPCGFEVMRPSLEAMRRRGWVQQLQAFSRATMRETWMAQEHRTALSQSGTIETRN